MFTGLWRDNAGLVQLLGICPLLAVANTAVNGFGLGIATLAVLCATNVLASAAGHRIPYAVRLPALLLIIAGFATVVELLCKAFFFNLYLALGVFLPLIVTNCTILGRAETAAARQPVGSALADGLVYGLGFTLLLVILGALRELLGEGTLFAGAETLFGAGAARFTLKFSAAETGFTLALLPAGAFFALAWFVALRNALGGNSEPKEAPVDR